MYYKFIDKPQNGMRVYIEKMLDNKHPAYGIIREELRTPGENDYFTIKNGEIKLISGRRDQDEFNDVIVAYPKGTKDICVYIEKNKSSLLVLSENNFIKDYKLNHKRNNLMGDLMGIDMCIEDFRKVMNKSPSQSDKKVWIQLWNDRNRVIKNLNKIEKKQKELLSYDTKKKKQYMER